MPNPQLWHITRSTAAHCQVGDGFGSWPKKGRPRKSIKMVPTAGGTIRCTQLTLPDNGHVIEELVVCITFNKKKSRTR